MLLSILLYITLIDQHDILLQSSALVILEYRCFDIRKTHF